jgi:hypothetical protein
VADEQQVEGAALPLAGDGVGGGGRGQEQDGPELDGRQTAAN